MSKTLLTILVLASHTVLLGCGTTGPLYIPEQRYPQNTQDEAPAITDAASAQQISNE